MNNFVAVSLSNIDGSSSFEQAFSLIKAQFMEVLRAMNLVKIFGDFTILDFFIAMLIFGSILPIVIITVNNWSSGAVSGAETRRSNAARERKTEEYRQSRLSQSRKK